MFSFLFSFAKEIESWPCERVKILQVYLPSGLFVIVSWISFIVPPEVVPGYTFSIFTFTFHNWFIDSPEVAPGFTFCFSLSLFIESLLKLLQVTGYTFHFHFSWLVYCPPWSCSRFHFSFFIIGLLSLMKLFQVTLFAFRFFFS